MMRQLGGQNALGKLLIELAGQTRLAEERLGALVLYLAQ
jgi:hypothetical protein